jgi:hypothetical protein
MEKLNQSQFHHKLMVSSRSLGQGGKLTARQKLKKSLTEHQLGMPISDPSVPLFVDVNASTGTQANQTAPPVVNKVQLGTALKPGQGIGILPKRIKPNNKVN